MPLEKFARFVAALLLGLVLTVSSYPVHSQESSDDSLPFDDDFPSFETCFNEVGDYPDKTDLDNYNQRQVYCLFVVELIGGGVEVDEYYDDENLKQVIQSALKDKNDAQDCEQLDDAQDCEQLDNKLTYAEITGEFPGNELSDLINEAVDEADKESMLLRSSPFKVAVDRGISDNSQTSSALKQSANGKSRGGTAVFYVAKNASQRRG